MIFIYQSHVYNYCLQNFERVQGQESRSKDSQTESAQTTTDERKSNSFKGVQDKSTWDIVSQII